MSLADLIAEAIANPPIHPVIGPRLQGLTVGDLVVRVVHGNVLSLLDKIEDLEIKHDTLGLESYEDEFLCSLKEELNATLSDYPCLKNIGIVP